MGEAKTRARQREKARLARRLPENFRRLHQGEFAIRTQAIAAIEGDPEMMDHVELMESVMDFLDFFATRKPADPIKRPFYCLAAEYLTTLPRRSGC